MLGRYLSRELEFQHVLSLRFFFGLIASSLALLVMHSPAYSNGHDASLILYLALVTGLLALGALLLRAAADSGDGRRRWPSSRIRPSAIVAGIYAYNQQLSWTQWLGVGLIIGSVTLLPLRRRRVVAEPPPYAAERAGSRGGICVGSTPWTCATRRRRRQFRAELRAWLDANLPEDKRGGRGGAQRFDDPFMREWSRKLYEAGYAGLTWPKEYGGAGAPYSFQAIFYEELAAAQAPAHIGVIGLGMAGPTIIAHGTEEQKARYLEPILSADEIWCQGFSEPDAGSDLAAARTRAERRGDVYVVNGQKVWSSFAHIADFCILVTQSDPDAPRYRNLTYLHRRHARARRRGAAAAADHRRGGVQRDLLQRRRGAGREPPRRRGRRLAGGDDDAPARARHARLRAHRRARRARRPAARRRRASA